MKRPNLFSQIHYILRVLLHSSCGATDLTFEMRGLFWQNIGVLFGRVL